MKILLDTYAILELVDASKKGEEVEKLLASSTNTYTTCLNVYEARYRLTQKFGEKKAEELINELITYAKIIDITLEISLLASEIKIKHSPLGAVDCNTYAAALQNNLMLVTGDKDFKDFKDVIML